MENPEVPRCKYWKGQTNNTSEPLGLSDSDLYTEKYQKMRLGS